MRIEIASRKNNIDANFETKESGDSDTKPSNPDSDLKESFIVFQNKTNNQFCHIMEYTIRQLTDTTLHYSLAELHSHQNNQDNSCTKDDDDTEHSTINKASHDGDIDETPYPSNTYTYTPEPVYVPTAVLGNTHPASSTNNMDNSPNPSALHKFWKVV